MAERDEDFSGTERFAVRRRLGGGGMGVVYEVFDHERRTAVALKTLKRVSGAEIYRLKQEFRALADVSHPNLVQLHELHARGEQVFFTMELLDGSDFLAWVRRDDAADSPERHAAAHAPTVSDPSILAGAAAGAASRPSTPGATPPTGPGRSSLAEGSSPGLPTLRLPASAPAKLGRLREGLRQLAEGIQALHDAGIVHRDVKPSNVIVTAAGRVVLLDFGLASPTVIAASAAGANDSGVVGTPAYMSPEQGAGGPVGPPGDWYALGVILFEALTGRLPFVGRSLQVLMDKQQFEPPAPRELSPAVPEDLDALCVALLRRKPEARPTGPEVLRRLGAGHVPSEALSSAHGRSALSQSRGLVGRDAELGQLRAAFDDSRAGRCVVANVYGASGIGKTALVRRVLDEIEARGEALVLTGRCYEMESVPFKAVDSLVDALSRHLGRMSRADAAGVLPRDIPLLARLFPVLLQVPAVADAPRRFAEPPDLQELRRRGFAALRELLLRLTDRRPLVLCIDDLQWGDADSAALLVELLRPPDPPPLLLIGIYRSEAAGQGAFASALAPALSESGIAALVRDVTLAPLPAASARELALRLLGAAPGAGEPPLELVRRAELIARESDGSPFFVSELVRHLQAGVDLAAATASGADAPSEAPSSDRGATLGGFLRARLVRLPAPARRLLEVVAVAATPISQAVARQAAGLAPGEVSAPGAPAAPDGAATIALLRAGHLVRTTGVRDLDTIESYHDRIRETVTALLAPDERAAHHRALAHALEGAGGADPETIALHFRGAGLHERAAHYTEQAAAQAALALAFQWAAVLYRQAIALREKLAAEALPAERAAHAEAIRALRVALGDALANAGAAPQAAEVYLAAAEGAQQAAVLELRRRAAEQLLRSGHLSEGLDVLATVLSAVNVGLARTPRRALGSLLLRRLQVRLRGLGFRERDPSQVAAETLTHVDIFWSVATALGMVDNIRAADFQSRHLLAALSAGEPYRVARALSTEACYSSADGPRAAARTAELVARAREVAARAGHPHALGMAVFADAFSAVMEGRFHDGAALTREAEQVFRERCRNVAWETTVMQQMNLTALFYTGELAEIVRRVPSLLEQARERGDLYATSALRSWTANLAWLVRDDLAGAREVIDDVSRAWPQGGGFILQHYWDLHARQNADLYAGDGPSAWARLSSVWPALASSLLLRISALHADAHWHRARAAVAAAVALPPPERAAAPLLRAATKAVTAITAQPFAPVVQALVAGDVAALRGDSDAACASFAAARRAAETLRLPLFAIVASRRLAQLTSDASSLAAADTALAAAGARHPLRMASLISPGTVLTP